MNLDAVTRFAADGILNSLFAGIAITAFGWAVTRLFRRQASGTRFTVWFIALIAIAVLPFAGHFASESHASLKLSAANTVTLPQSFATYLSIAWIIGAALGFMPIAHGLYRLRRLRATCTPVDPGPLDASLREAVENLRKYRHVTLCTSDAIRVPAAIGYFHPMVVFPSWALSEIRPAELNAILLHELEHLRRWDDFTNLAQKIFKAIFFFHPAVWFIESRLTLEREMACDDAVLAASFNPRAYAESLIDLAERSFLRRGVQLAQAAVGHVQQLKLRLAEILRKDRSPQGRARLGKPAVAFMSLVGIVSFYGVAHAPRLVAFSADVPRYTAASTPTPATVSKETTTELQPINLNYVETAEHAVSTGRRIEPTGRIEPIRVRCSRRAVLTPRINLVQRTLVARHYAELNDPLPPVLLLSHLPMELPPAPALVIFNAQQFGADGPILWRVTIVHLTAAEQRAITGGIAKQI